MFWPFAQCNVYFIIIKIKSFTEGVVGALHMILQPFFFLPYSFDTVYVIVYSIAFNDLLSNIVGCFLYLRLSPP